MSGGFETRAIHAGQDPDPDTGAVVTPITLATTFAQARPGEPTAYEYGRSGNPTRHALEVCLASLESAAHGYAFASGMAAEDCVLRALAGPGGHVVLPNDIYGGTFRLVNRVFAPVGVTWSVADFGDLAALDAAWPAGTTVVWIETPTNPTLSIIDVAAVATLAHAHGARRRGRQHLRDSVPPAPPRARGRRRRALGDEVPRWSLRRGGRVRGHQRS